MTDSASKIWLKNGVWALAIAGLYSIVLVVLRTPQLSQFFADQSIFKSALVIHVNLSVLVWLLSITCYVWSIGDVKLGFEEWLARAGFISMVLMSLSPLYPESVPVMNNYVPMLENIVFVTGLAIFGTVVLCLSLLVIFTSFQEKIMNSHNRIIVIVKLSSALMYILVWVCFTLSFFALDDLSDIVPLDLDFYYEMLFWSGGHLLQFIYTQILMLALMVLAEIWRGKKLAYVSIYEMLFVLNATLGLLMLVGHYKYSLADGAFKEFFTLHMIYSAGIAPIIFITSLALEIMQKRQKSVQKFVIASFLASVILFLSGGAIGASISGVNVTIPAHYHGSIVGISVAFMGFSYVYCFKSSIFNNIKSLSSVVNILFQIKSVKSGKDNSYQNLAFWQIIILTCGQMLHIAGLALSGGYGVLRKTPGSDFPLHVKFYLGMMGGGGLLAIIGGLMFVYIYAKTKFRN